MLRDSRVEPSPLTLLLAATAARDQRAFAELYAASSAKLYGIILRILGDREQANEMLQEAYLRICASGSTPPTTGRTKGPR